MSWAVLGQVPAVELRGLPAHVTFDELRAVINAVSAAVVLDGSRQQATALVLVASQEEAAAAVDLLHGSAWGSGQLEVNHVPDVQYWCWEKLLGGSAVDALSSGDIVGAAPAAAGATPGSTHSSGQQAWAPPPPPQQQQALGGGQYAPAPEDWVPSSTSRLPPHTSDSSRTSGSGWHEVGGGGGGGGGGAWDPRAHQPRSSSSGAGGSGSGSGSGSSAAAAAATAASCSTGRVLVRNLHPDVTEEQVAATFKRFGRVADVCKHPNKRFAHVQFKSADGAAAAVRALHLQQVPELNDIGSILVEPAAAASGRQPGGGPARDAVGVGRGAGSGSGSGGNKNVSEHATRSLWVGNIGGAATPADVKAVFGRFGPLQQYQLHQAPFPGNAPPMQYSVVVYHRQQDAEAAFAALHRQVVETLGRYPLKLKYRAN